MTRFAILFALIYALALPLLAVEPDEIMDDPALEARARAISEQLRCLVCRNENIDESGADLARDLRLLVRERLSLGDSDVEVIEFIVARYGDWVLLKPRFAGGNILLWLAAPAFLGIGLGATFLYIRRRGKTPAPQSSLTANEQARLDALLNE